MFEGKFSTECRYDHKSVLMLYFSIASVFSAGWGQILRAGKGSFSSVGALTDLVIVLALVKNFSEIIEWKYQIF